MTRKVRPVGLNQAAWTEAYGTGLRSYFRRRANPSDVDDLVQEVFCCLEDRNRSVSVADPARYTFGIARNVLARYHRDRIEGDIFPLDAVNESDISDHLSPERIAIGRQEYERAIAAILALPPRARIAFQLRRFERMSYEEIAEQLGITRNSTKELIARALAGVTKAMMDKS